MSADQKPQEVNRILDAIRAKRDKRTGKVADIEALEASLIADIESFDLNEAERLARSQPAATAQSSIGDGLLSFPQIDPDGSIRDVGHVDRQPAERPSPQQIVAASNLLFQLRQQADIQERELHAETAVRSASNLAVEGALKDLFYFLHELVQQLNIVKPAVHRNYSAAGDISFNGLTWQEGFADYRTQSQSRGAMVELVTLSCQLVAPADFTLLRDGPGVERLRLALFDFGLQFNCKEFRNERGYIERAEFAVSRKLNVSARWKADFRNGVLVVESRNLERLGSVSDTIRPQAVDAALLDEFGRLILGHPNRFRELAKR